MITIKYGYTAYVLLHMCTHIYTGNVKYTVNVDLGGAAARNVSSLCRLTTAIRKEV